MSHVLSDQDARAWAWPPVGQVDEPLRTPLWLIRTLATALAAETDEHHRTSRARSRAPPKRSNSRSRNASLDRVEVAGRTALITGGAAGTGRAIAHRLAAAGAHVIVADLRRGDVGRFVCMNASEPNPRAFEGVDILVNNAGGGHWPPHYPEP